MSQIEDPRIAEQKIDAVHAKLVEVEAKLDVLAAAVDAIGEKMIAPMESPLPRQAHVSGAAAETPGGPRA